MSPFSKAMIAAVVFALGCVLAYCSAAPPPLPAPLGIPVTPKRAELGRKLFFDPRLSQPIPGPNGQLLATVSCATCHRPNHGFSDPNPVAVGILGRQGTRKTPTVLLAPYSPLQFHDGRTIGAPTQSTQPIENVLEMGNQTFNQMLSRLRRIGYEPLFADAYGPGVNGRSAIDRDRFGHAVTSYECTLVSFDAPIDRRLDGDLDALTPEAEIGYQLCLKAQCFDCHKPPLFMDLKFHNNGFEMAARPVPQDQGRVAIDTRPQFARENTRAFKTPTLREVQRRPPYGHHGRFSLDRVIEHYNAGGGFVGTNGQRVRDRFIDERVQPQGWTDYQRLCVKTFLETAFASPNYPEIGKPDLPGD